MQKFTFFFFKLNILLLRNNLAGPVSLVKLAWKSRSQYWFEKKLFGLLYPTWTNFSEKIFSNNFLSCFEWKYCAVSQNVIFMSFIYLNFSNYKFLTFCSIDWFWFQKSFAIGPFRIWRCQDFGDKSLGWFLGFQYMAPNPDVLFHNYFGLMETLFVVCCLCHITSVLWQQQTWTLLACPDLVVSNLDMTVLARPCCVKLGHD